MSEQLQLRRGPASALAAFTPANGECVVDTTNDRIVVGDGSTVGGWPAAKISEVILTGSLGTGVAAALADNVGSAGAFVVNGGALGTPSSGTATNLSGLPLTGVSGLGSGVATALAVAVGSAGAPVTNGGALGAPSSGNLTSCNLAQSAHGATCQIVYLEQLVSGLSGATVNAGTQIPAGALVVACSARVTTTITGATSWTLGYTGSGGSTSAFGSGLSLPAGSTNEGLMSPGPTPFYSATNIVLTATGSNFTAGAVRLSLAYMIFTPPTS